MIKTTVSPLVIIILYFLSSLFLVEITLVVFWSLSDVRFWIFRLFLLFVFLYLLICILFYLEELILLHSFLFWVSFFVWIRLSFFFFSNFATSLFHLLRGLFFSFFLFWVIIYHMSICTRSILVFDLKLLCWSSCYYFAFFNGNVKNISSDVFLSET